MQGLPWLFGSCRIYAFGCEVSFVGFGFYCFSIFVNVSIIFRLRDLGSSSHLTSLRNVPFFRFCIRSGTQGQEFRAIFFKDYQLFNCCQDAYFHFQDNYQTNRQFQDNFSKLIRLCFVENSIRFGINCIVFCVIRYGIMGITISFVFVLFRYFVLLKLMVVFSRSSTIYESSGSEKDEYISLY